MSIRIKLYQDSRVPAVAYVVRKEGPNKGRRFWTCSGNLNPCNFLAWDTTPATKPLPPQSAARI